MNGAESESENKGNGEELNERLVSAQNVWYPVIDDQLLRIKGKGKEAEEIVAYEPVLNQSLVGQWVSQNRKLRRPNATRTMVTVGDSTSNEELVGQLHLGPMFNGLTLVTRMTHLFAASADPLLPILQPITMKPTFQNLTTLLIISAAIISATPTAYPQDPSRREWCLTSRWASVTKLKSGKRK
ncbi:hypothetical protein BDQ17DRAFT_1328363 [Cyathus striatus]|nr:hypothetical protein BDQ17DRAFT_1328363 [Cyathus striatus]